MNKHVKTLLLGAKYIVPACITVAILVVASENHSKAVLNLFITSIVVMLTYVLGMVLEEENKLPVSSKLRKRPR